MPTAVTYSAPGLVITEHVIDVPLDHTQPSGEQLSVFAREVSAPSKLGDDLPWLLFLQGGPGFESPRPSTAKSPAWLERALESYRVLFLDQRGMGRSTPLLTRLASDMSAEDLASRLTLFRADSIVRDAEVLREHLGVAAWSVLGQSFGGFCAVTYLSLFPRSLRQAFITGGLPPLNRSIDDVYSATYRTTIAKSRAYYSRYPADRARARQLLDEVTSSEVWLPSGDRLTASRVRQLGLLLGMGDGFERLHYLLELPFNSSAFLHDVEAASPFSRNPLYAVVHESCYAPSQATRWSAQRMLPASYEQDPTLFTGEHILQDMFDDMSALRPFAATAQLLADHEWGPLYNASVLSTLDVPCAAIVYADDMYVDAELSKETASQINGLRVWLTNEYEHDGLGASGGKVLDRLIAMAEGTA